MKEEFEALKERLDVAQRTLAISPYLRPREHRYRLMRSAEEVELKRSQAEAAQLCSLQKEGGSMQRYCCHSCSLVRKIAGKAGR